MGGERNSRPMGEFGLLVMDREELRRVPAARGRGAMAIACDYQGAGVHGQGECCCCGWIGSAYAWCWGLQEEGVVVLGCGLEAREEIRPMEAAWIWRRRFWEEMGLVIILGFRFRKR